MGNFSRTGTSWMFKARGYYTRNTKTSDKLMPVLKQVMSNNLTHVKVGHDGKYKLPYVADEDNEGC